MFKKKKVKQEMIPMKVAEMAATKMMEDYQECVRTTILKHFDGCDVDKIMNEAGARIFMKALKIFSDEEIEKVFNKDEGCEDVE